jgi:hypothetical protein
MAKKRARRECAPVQKPGRPSAEELLPKPLCSRIRASSITCHAVLQRQDVGRDRQVTVIPICSMSTS